MKRICSLGLMVLAFMMFQACNNSGNSSKQTADSINKANKPVSDDASKFMEKAAIGGMMEVQMGKVAQQQATLQRVKDFGSMMVTDHSRLNNKLKMLAQNKNVALPDSLDQDHQKDIADLKEKTGQDFDENYIDEMVKDHKKDINDFEKAAEDIQDSDIKGFINKALPVLKMHLDSAQAIQNDIENQNQ